MEKNRMIFTRLKEKAAKTFEKIGRYKYAALVFLLGVIFLILPPKAKQTERAKAEETVSEQSLPDLQKQLEKLLSHVDGAGRAEVLLSVAYSAETEYQTDTEDSDGGRNVETVLVQSGGSQQSALTVRTRYPVYKGAVVVCEGGDRPAVKLAIVEAVSRLTGLGADKISVVKMKG